MSDDFHSSDTEILDLLRRRGELTVNELSELLSVTPTAVRQRLNRLMFQGFVERHDRRQSRGRPTHGYELTSSGKRKAGENFADLATALWSEITSLEDVDLRRKLIEGVARRLARLYSRHIDGESVEERMEAIASLFGDRQIPMAVEEGSADGYPVLNVMACPYPDLAKRDESICWMERTLIAELTGKSIELAECTVQGGTCCRFSAVDSEREVSAEQAVGQESGGGELTGSSLETNGGSY